MDHVAIDLGGRESQICIRRSDGTITREERRATQSLERLFAELPPSRVILETCAEAFAAADAARRCGHEVRVVPSTLVRALGVGARRIKNDRRDAERLSEASCRMDLPSVHVPSEQARALKTLCGMREALGSARTKLINTVRGWLRGQGWTVKRGAVETMPMRVRDRALLLGKTLPSYVERQLQAIEQLTESMGEADGELQKEARSSEVCQRLMSVPGVGPVVSVRFVATLDQCERFTEAHRVASYLGLTPSEHSSSDRQRRGAITKAGSPRMRWALVQAAWTAVRCRPNDPMVRWAVEVAKRRGKQVAIVALSRKIATLLFALWRDGTRYDPLRAAALPPEPRATALAAIR